MITAPKRRRTFSPRTLLVAATALVSFIGCSPSSETKIVGKWEGHIASDDAEKMALQAEAQFVETTAVPNLDVHGVAKKALATAWIKREYLADGTITMSAGGHEIAGTWKHLGADAYRLTWDDEPSDVTVKFDGPDSFSESDTEGSPNLQFEREKPDRTH